MITFVKMDSKEKSIAFTGHRHYRGEAASLLSEVLSRLYHEGFRNFLCGMAVGFDLAAAEAVVDLKRVHPDIRLIAVVPWPGQAAHFSLEERRRYVELLELADQQHVLSMHYTPACYHRRNDFLVEHASRVVAWYDGSAGGTRYTLQRARRMGLPVENLCPDPQLSIF